MTRHSVYFLNASPHDGGHPTPNGIFRTGTLAGFVQDDWKSSPNLTLNLGLRTNTIHLFLRSRSGITNLVLGPPGQELTGSRSRPNDPLYQASKKNFRARVWPSLILPTKFWGRISA